ncbi:MAG: hypothetical protein ACFCU3_03910 [Verrucomicrobiales bacterium]
MAWPHPQNPLDWLSQYWNIRCGRRVDMKEDAWLLGPIGAIGERAETFIDRIAQAEGLATNPAGLGLVDDLNTFDVSVKPSIKSFYERTSEFTIDAWTRWNPIFGTFGYLINRLYSRRIQQLNLPLDSLDTAGGISSEIIWLTNADNQPIYRIWHRRLRQSGEVIFYGIYTDCLLPSGRTCIKAIFPLPRGSATVIFSMSADPAGNLELLSSGKTYGDPGFYFIVEDQRGALWKHYLKSFHERLYLFEDPDGIVRADHTMSLGRNQVYGLHYKLTHRRGGDQNVNPRS